ncbi:MAG: hypothetical protein KAT90_11690 [Gammaproteobacteria bacterium]|nr:hypothetical protein [Gammaproteobacteria bacterium]
MSILNKKLVVTMPDGSKWAVSVMDIASHRAVFFAKDFGGDIKKSLKEGTEPLFESDSYEIRDWAANNMNWDDVKVFAKRIKLAVCDFEDGWINGEYEVV